MNPILEQLHWNERRRIIDAIMASPHRYKLCDQCLAISLRTASVCQVCSAYRFCNDQDAICAVARVMAASPWPFTAGVVPRLKPAFHIQTHSLQKAVQRPLQKIQRINLRKNCSGKNKVLETVPYNLPEKSALNVIPRCIGSKAILVYAVSPIFWALFRVRRSQYKVQMVTSFGAGHAGYIVTPRAAAEFIRLTAHLKVLMKHLHTFGYRDLLVELESFCEPN